MTAPVIVPVVDEGLGMELAGYTAVAVLPGGPVDWAGATGRMLDPAG